jgi:hypothetical protein
MSLLLRLINPQLWYCWLLRNLLLFERDVGKWKAEMNMGGQPGDDKALPVLSVRPT